ncbi:MAG: MFS transporter [Chloroflexi bacterium]|nr:MFS transporter [Chloroflexota bacterium]
MTNLLSLKPNEGRLSALMIGIMLFCAIGAALGGTGIEALFFARFGTDYLPFMYLGLGITSMITSFIVTAALGRIPKRIVYTAIPILIALLLIGARLALFTQTKWLYPSLWLGKEVLNALIGLMIWGIAGLACDARQAKRLFPLFNAAFIFGQVIGGFATGLLVNIIGTENLIIVWAGSLIVAFLFSRALLARQQIESAPQRKSKRLRQQPTLAQEMQRGFQYVRTSPLLTAASLSTIFFSILYFSIALPFSRTVAAQYPDENSLASFLGIFNGLTTAGAFITSLFFTNRLFARVGIMACIFALPVIYILGFGSLILAPLFVIVIGFRFIQMLYLSGVADPAWQTMFNVVPNEKRDQVRAFVGGVPEQAGVFIAGGILIVGEQTLNPQQLYIIGFIAALGCAWFIFKAWRGYNLALVDALRAGRPQLFFCEEQPFGGFRQDAAAVQTALTSLRDSDPIVRRISAEIVGHLSLPESTQALIIGLSDVDSLVRLSALQALSHSKATPALLDIAASLSDPEPDVRSQAIAALTVLSPTSPALTKLITPLLDDEDSKVSVGAALCLLRVDNANAKAKDHLRIAATFGELDTRVYAIQAMGEWGDREAFDFLSNELQDQAIHPTVKNSILTALAQINPRDAIPHLLEGLRIASTRHTSAHLLGNLGADIVDAMIDLLKDESSVDGALLTLERLPPPPKRILEFVRAVVSRSGEYDALRRSIPPSGRNEALQFLEETLLEKSHHYGIQSLRAIGLLGNRDSMNLAIENLQSRDAGQRANVIEALETISAKYRDIIQPLIKLWEDDNTQPATCNTDWPRLLNDPDEWIRECAAFAKNYGEVKMDTLAALSMMDRILFLRKVPLFADLSSADLKQVAAISEEVFFADGDVLTEQDEPGDEMYVIVSGEVRVCIRKGERQVEMARRRMGECVGELAVVNREPRMATLIASGDVHTLCIDRQSFEGLLRERPEVSLVVIKVLSKRLKEATR